MKIKIILPIVALLLNAYSCVFSPSEIPITEVEKPSVFAPPIDFELKPEKDTIKLSVPIWVSYMVDSDEREIYLLKIEINGEEVQTVFYEAENKISAYINTEQLNNGLYELKVSVYTATNSGSIADKVGSEAYFYEFSWPVLVNKLAKENFKFEPVDLLSGNIKIEWSKYDYADFDRYEFQIYIEGMDQKKLTITDPLQHTFLDGDYVEGLYSTYMVFVFYEAGGYSFDRMVNVEAIKAPMVSVGEKGVGANLRWTPPLRKSNVKSYCIMVSKVGSITFDEYDLNDLSDTTLNLNTKFGFGYDYLVQLRYIPKTFNGHHSRLITLGGINNCSVGDSVAKFQRAIHFNNGNIIILYNDGQFSQYHLSNGEQSAKIAITPIEPTELWTVKGSPDGNYFSYFEDKKLVIRNSSDFSLVRKTEIEAFNNSNFGIFDYSLSNNAWVAIASHFNNLRIFNTVTGEKIIETQIDKKHTLRSVLLSPKADYIALIINDSDLATQALIYYKIENKQLIEVGRVNAVGIDHGALIAFGISSSNKIVVSRWRDMYEYVVEIRDVNTFEVISSVNLPQFYIPVGYDAEKEQFIARHNYSSARDYSYLVDVKTGSMKKVIQFIGNGPWIVTGGRAFAGNGRTIAIDQYLFD